MAKIIKKKTLTICLAAAALFSLPFSAPAANKLVVKDTGGAVKFVVTDAGNVGVGSENPVIPLHVYTTDVAPYPDIFGINQASGTGADIQTATGAPPAGPVQAVNNEFLIRYTPGAPITNNFNTFRMIVRTDAAVSDDIDGHIAAANFMSQHNGTGTAFLNVGFITNVINKNTGTITNAEAIRAANPVNNGGGTITNAMGIRIQPQAISGVVKAYGLYQEGVNDSNYFAGKIGIGVTAPAYPLELSGGAYSDGTTWTTASSRDLKENISSLSSESAYKALDELIPVTFNYKSNSKDNHVGFISEDVPEIVATPDRKGLSALDIVGVLTKVVQEQNITINQMHEKINKLETQIRMMN